MEATATMRLGCDVGGTFTDFILLDTSTGDITAHKCLTTPEDPSVAILDGIRDLEVRRPGSLGRLQHLIHGTTLAINAIIERKGARTALLTTRGFKDILELRRHMRNDVYDVTGDLQIPLVPRDLRYEVDERVYSDGRILRPLDETGLRAICADLRRRNVESVAISFLHAYAYPEHERAAGRIVGEELPGVAISLSSEVHPEMKEFERTSTTVVNAYTRPVVHRYLTRLDDQLRSTGSDAAILLMHSVGGLIARRTAAEFPVRIIESGPVAGMLAAGLVGARLGKPEVLAFDMGGTTAKVCVIAGSELPITSEFEVDRAIRFRKGSGLPVAIPAIDLVEVGAGGGSIAEVNDRGLLSVGPKSAGAEPGPACYARGGIEPTVTDADVVLGYLDPGYFLGGRMRLDPSAALRAIRDRVAGPLDLDAERAAWGIHEQVNENMAAAVSAYLAEHGKDPRKLALVAFGGAGPVHAYGLARKLGIVEIVVPRAAGVASALGFLLAPISYSLARTWRRPLDGTDAANVGHVIEQMRREALEVLREAEPDGEFAFTASADVCYSGQDHSLSVPFTSFVESEVRSGFLGRYRELYGLAYEDVPLEISRLRLTGRSLAEPPNVAVTTSRAGVASGGALKGQRSAYDGAIGSRRTFDVYDRTMLGPGSTITGPAVIEEAESTTVVGTEARASVTVDGHLRVVLPGAG